MKNYKVEAKDVMDFLRQMGYNCTGNYVSAEDSTKSNLTNYEFDGKPTIFEWKAYDGSKDSVEVQVKPCEFILVENDYNYGKKTVYNEDKSQLWQDFQADRHQEDYLPCLINWVSERINNLIKERESKKAALDQEKRRIDYSYELDINYYKNKLNMLKNRNEQMSM